ncbi:MAG TPA: DUF6603 domain-containing protein, partial [Pyrinomonadaceae bacterium]|nr:DUF6603 domain-containing protein [Pyrinomonadaceae bacterium]
IDSPPDLSSDLQLTQGLNEVVTRAGELTSLIDQLLLAREEGDTLQIVAAGAALLEKCNAVRGALDTVGVRLQTLLAATPGGAELAEELAERVIGDVVSRYLDSEYPLLRRVLTLAAVLDWDVLIREVDESAGLVRRRLHFDRLTKVLTDPVGLLESGYRWGHSDFDGRRLLQRISELTEPLDPIGAVGDEAELPVIPEVEFGVFALTPASTTPPGLKGELFVDAEENAVVELRRLSDETRVQLRLGGKFSEGLTVQLLPPTSLELAPPPAGTLNGDVALEVVSSASAPAVRIFLAGVAGVGHIEAKSVAAAIQATGSWSPGAARATTDVGLRANINGGRLVVSVEDGDDFLSEVLPAGAMEADFDLEVGWTAAQGFQIKGGAGLKSLIPINRSLGPIVLQAVNFGGKIDSEALLLTVGLTARVQLGPLNARIDDVGVRFKIDFAVPGNLGAADLALGFKPPGGIGLSVDGGGFKGGGFLDFDPEEESYSGMLELEFQDQFTLKAFGLLTTRLPNNQKGFSLLIVISSEFTPIQLGLGFKLNGVGGLLGLNRTVNVEPLRAGLRQNTLNSILFPTDIVANADRIISDLKQVFPPQAGRFIFGPMAKIAWGTPTLVTVDLGLVIEIPEPVRLFILGVLRAVLPDENASILRVQVNFLGEINFERRQLKFDASLFDSKLLGFTLTGDMAIRLDWGADANFLLTVGGFHPAYEPPPMDLPPIRRLTLALLDGDNPRLKLEMYFAVTSNTAQFGAKLELYAAAWKFNVYGFLTFDVLFQFSPFYFIAEITAMLALRIGSSSFASIQLSLTLEGPTPWKAQGTARFKICWFFTLKVRFNKTFGETRNTTLPDLAVLPLLAEALRADDNWEGELPAQRHRLESIRKAPELTGELLLHPIGTLKISQKVVPLNVRVDRIGSQRPSDAREFQITGVQPEATPIVPQEAFAPAQFFDLTDEEKLTSASFKDFDSGIRIGDAERLHTGYAAAREVKYELKYIDSQREQRLSGRKDLFDLNAGAFNTWTLQGAIAQSELSFARTRKSALAPEAVVVSQESFAIVNSGDLKLFDELSLLGSERAAAARLNQLIELNPTLRGTLQIVPAFERAA